MPNLAAKLKSNLAQTVAPHLVITARAGTGKTTTLIEGLKAIQGETSEFTPSYQQAAIWEEMKKTSSDASACFVAFNKSIATELQDRVPEGVSAMTMHSMGCKSLRGQFPNSKFNKWKTCNIIEHLTDQSSREIRKKCPEIIIATQKLVDLVRMNLSDTDKDTLIKLAVHYDIDSNGSANKVLELVPQVVEERKDVTRWGYDFADMIWIPVALDLPVTKYDLLLVDEAQDLNKCQQELAIKAGRRLIFCGDDRQAIYGFCGADSKSLTTLEQQLSSTDFGCVTLPLTVTRRCGKAIVAEAKKIVSDFEVHESNGEGAVKYAHFYGKDTTPDFDHGKNEGTIDDLPLAKRPYRPQVSEGDMILCRVNAPLVSECFKFLREGRKATIQGRNVAEGLTNTIKKLMSPTGKAKDFSDMYCSVLDLEVNLDAWKNREFDRENTKKNPNEDKLIRIQDKNNCLICFCEESKTVGDVLKKIEEIFTDNKDNPGIKLSSIHKAKGLEAKRVFLIEPKGATVPHPMAKSDWQKDQEWNLRYVAITRAIEEIVFVS